MKINTEVILFIVTAAFLLIAMLHFSFFVRAPLPAELRRDTDLDFCLAHERQWARGAVGHHPVLYSAKPHLLPRGALVLAVGARLGVGLRRLVREADNSVKFFCFEPAQQYVPVLREKFRPYRNVKIFPLRPGEEEHVLRRPEFRRPEFIHFLRINCKGCEYRFLDALGQLAGRVALIEVHFADAGERYCRLREKLKATHEVLFDYPSAWTAFVLRGPYAAGSKLEKYIKNLIKG